MNDDSFCRLPVTSAQAVIETVIYPDTGIILNYNDDEYSQGYSQIKEVFRACTKHGILQPYISDDDSRYSNVGVVELGYSLFVFHMRYQQTFTAFKPIKVKFKLDGVVPNDLNGYALVLTTNLVGISSNEQRCFDLI